MATIDSVVGAAEPGGKARPGTLREEVLAALAKPLPPIRKDLLYRVGLIAVAVTMVLLPLVYVGLMVLVGWLIYLHAIHNAAWLEMVHGRAMALTLILYATPLLGGVVALLFMFKPFFAPRGDVQVPLSLEPNEQPRLFDFVHRLCDAVRAPRPSRIDVNIEANASASFRRGVRSFFNSDLVLTIGLPLVSGMNMRQFAGVLAHEFGHFTQGGGMRLTYLIRATNAWFARVAYERDAWDMKLEQWASDSPHWVVSIVVQTTRLCVWASRQVLKVLMYAGHAVSCAMLRQMEYDADRYEASIAGSAGFAATTRRLADLGAAWQITFGQLRQSFQSSMLADDLPEMVRRRAGQLKPEVMRELDKLVNEQKTRWFDTHPSNPDRVASANRLAAPGVFRVEAPAPMLFNNYERLCKLATSHFFHSFLGEEMSQVKVVPVDQIIRSHEADDKADEALLRFFQYRPVLPARIAIAPPTRDLLDEAQANPGAAVRAARRQYERAVKQAESVLRYAETAGVQRIEARRAFYLARLGFRMKPGTTSVPAESREALSEHRQLCEEEYESAAKGLTALNKLAGRRITTAVRYIDRNAERFKNAESHIAEARRLIDAVNAMGRAHDELRDMVDAFDEMHLLFGNLKGNEDHEPLIRRIRELMRELTNTLRALSTAFERTPYPLPHGKGAVTISEYAFGEMPAEEEPAAIAASVELALERLADLFFRSLARLAWLCERVEAAVGLKKMPQPPEQTPEATTPPKTEAEPQPQT